MSSTRRFCVVFGALSSVAILGLLQLVHAEGKMALKERIIEEMPGSTGYSNAIRFPKDSKAQGAIRSATDLLQDKNWGKAVEVLDFLLGRGEDGFVQITRDVPGGQPITVWVSIRAEANRLIGTMPKEGLDIYQTLYGGEAGKQLNDATASGDMAGLAAVAQRYLHTKAGARATELLGTRCLEREEPLMATLFFERLLARKHVGEPSTQLLLKAALAYYRAGDKVGGDEVWKLLKDRAKQDGGISVNGKLVSVELVRADLDKIKVPEVQYASDWPQFRGSVGRTVQGIGGPPFLEPTWELGTTLPVTTTAGNHPQLAQEWVKSFIAVGTQLADERGLAVMPAFFPIAVGNKLVYRTYDGIYVADLKKEGKLEWYNQTDGGSLTLLSDGQKKSQLDTWATTYKQSGPKSVIYENSVLGTLSTDNTRIFAVDDLILTPHPTYMRQFGGQPNFGHLNEMVNRNVLKCYNLESGKLMWELGGRLDASDLKDSFFLGAPLCMGGKIYLLNEKDNGLRLVCLEPKDSNENPIPPTIVWTQTLATTTDKIQFDFNRRIHAANIAYGDGILVCPTNAGAVLGVDLLSHSLVWAHTYREGSEEGTGKNPAGAMPAPGLKRIDDGRYSPLNSLNNDWKVSAPAIHEGKVVFTAPDGAAVHCLNLRDGRIVWRHNRSQDDLFFAGIYHGKAVIVSKNTVRALNLLDGKEVWRVDNTGMPSGQGVASDNIYYLPIKAANDSKEPEVLSIDIEKGVVVAHTKSRKRDGKMEVPGNLIFHDGQVLSQGLERINSYPQLKVKLAKIDALIAKNPNDPIGLTERGELRLDKGELQGAIDDLHQALHHIGATPPPEHQVLIPKARLKLYESLTQLLQESFNQGERYLDEYKDLCKHDNAEEQVKRQSNYLVLVAKGREKQGKLLDAFQAYMDFTALTGDRQLVSVLDQVNTKSRPDVWARGRIAAMMAVATPEQRRPLEEKITEQWQTIKDTNDIDALRRFVSLFGNAFKVGKQAKLRLAERLMVQNQEDGLRDAQLLLLTLRDQRGSEPELGAQAVDALARLHLQKGALDHAIHYYKELGRSDLAKVIVRDGKSGGDIWGELATDKRFLPYLDGVRHSWTGKFKASDSAGQNQPQQKFTLEPSGDLLPFFLRHRFVLETQTQQLAIVDQSTGEERFRTGGLGIGAQYIANNAHQPLKVSYQVQGSVAIVNLGPMVFGFDPIDKKKLWEFNLLAGQNVPVQQIMRDRDGQLMIVYQDGFTQRIGQTGPVEASYVCLQTRNGLVALDPAKGSVLWTKSGVSPRTHLFGDEEHIYLVDMNNDGSASSGAWAVRASDGVMVKVPDFTEAYQKKQRVLGRTILVKDEAAQGEVVLRLYDAHTGKDVWKKTFPANSIVLKPDEDYLTGAIEPDGAVTVFDLRTQKEVLKSTLDWKEVLEPRGLDITKVLGKVTEAHLLQDHNQFYIALNKPFDAEAVNAVWTNVYMMRAISVNGMMYAFDKGSGKTRWADQINNQMLILEQFKDLPLLMFTARHNKARGGNVVATKTMHKISARLIYDKEMQNGNQYHSIIIDAKKQTIDLVSWNYRVHHLLEAPAEQPK
ncbi:MAG: PQQ-binding-like beta-propeller repeat protein [Gemmataceae bacterium]|nr:PQQ-binding-like beta-propeller repeat protein [Gemmataceae bacterium]